MLDANKIIEVLDGYDYTDASKKIINNVIDSILDLFNDGKLSGKDRDKLLTFIHNKTNGSKA